jgi:hypothetical protein
MGVKSRKKKEKSIYVKILEAVSGQSPTKDEIHALVQLVENKVILLKKDEKDSTGTWVGIDTNHPIYKQFEHEIEKENKNEN